MAIGEMQIMDRTGDIRIIWDSTRNDEVENARKQFDEFTKKKKYRAFTVKKDGSQGAIMSEFDPEAEKMILTPQLQGG